MAADEDPTIRLAPAAGAAARRPPVQQATASASLPKAVPRAVIAGAAGLTLLGGLAGWLLLSPAEAPPPAPTAAVVTAPPPPARPATPLLDEPGLLALQPAQPRMVRLSSNPRVFVLLFPELEQQGAALNRVAALVEKQGLPRDRLLNDAELAAAIAASGDTPATWFFGHDYRAEDLRRFFALAERDRVALNEAELWVQDRLREALAEALPGEPLALVSTANAGPRMDAVTRAAILKHEISHGHYFTIPSFAQHVQMVWRERFAAADRQALTALFGREGYDTTNPALMANEAMAYLLFTPDPRIFNAGMLGLTEPQLDRLRGLMRDGLPLP